MVRYGADMIEALSTSGQADGVESVMREELAHGDAMLGTITPILRHLIANEDHSVFGDDIIARVRGMLNDLANQLLDALHAAGGEGEHAEHDPARIADIVRALADVPGLMTHAHALAIEWQLSERLHARLALDPVLTPLLQALIASPEAGTAGAAMNLLAAQARFVQEQRRMQLPLGELPGDLLHGALLVMQSQAGSDEDAAARLAKAEQMIRARFDESVSRLGLIARLVIGMGAGAVAALSITHAGVAIFTSALALTSGQDRDIAVLSTNESQLARLALSLRASGLKPTVIEEQFLSLHPEVSLPQGFDRLGADRAAAILAVQPANARG